MAQLFRPRANTVGRLVLVAVALMPACVLAFHVLLMGSAYLANRGSTPIQPVPFSHKHHVGEDRHRLPLLPFRR